LVHDEHSLVQDEVQLLVVLLEQGFQLLGDVGCTLQSQDV